MKNVIEFLTQLKENNNREWFNENKKWYQEALAGFNIFAEKLISGIGQFDPSVQGLTLKECTYRIYRDVRFSKDKSPYKTHMGVYISYKGKNAGYAGYYFHLEPSAGGMLGGNLLTSGLYMPMPKVLKSVREEIEYNGEEFIKNINKAKGFLLETGEEHKLKRIPTGFPADHPYGEYLKLKDFYLTKTVDNSFLLQPDMLEKILEDYKKTKDFILQINKAADYAFEEM